MINLQISISKVPTILCLTFTFTCSLPFIFNKGNLQKLRDLASFQTHSVVTEVVRPHITTIACLVLQIVQRSFGLSAGRQEKSTIFLTISPSYLSTLCLFLHIRTLLQFVVYLQTGVCRPTAYWFTLVIIPTVLVSFCGVWCYSLPVCLFPFIFDSFKFSE